MQRQVRRVKVLVTGASGYVGSRLVPRLLDAGHQVRVSVTSEPDPDKLWWLGEVEVARMDVMETADVLAAVDGVDAVYYLIHGLDAEDFTETDRVAAEHVAAAVSEHRVRRVVYLSGIVPDVPDDEQSEHIASRKEVEKVLREQSGPQAVVIALRAAILLGAGSTSFEIVRQISERLPVQTVPTWMDSDVQPIAVVDVIEALLGALTVDTGSRSYDVGGTERLRYAALIAAYADAAGLTRVQVPVPLLPTKLVGALAGRLTDVPTLTVEALVESLHHDMVCGDDEFRGDLLPDGWTTLGVRESVERALRPPADAPVAQRDPMGLLPQDPDWAG